MKIGRRYPTIPLDYDYKNLVTSREVCVDYNSGDIYISNANGVMANMSERVISQLENIAGDNIAINILLQGKILTLKECLTKLNRNKIIIKTCAPISAYSNVNILTDNDNNTFTDEANILTK